MISRPTGKKIAAYLRVSSDKQDSQRQRESIEQWTSRLGLTIADWFVDDAGRNPRDKPEKRKQFQRLLKAVEAGLFDLVVVESQDRFGVADSHQLGKYVSLLREHGCELWSVAQGSLSSTDDAAVLSATLGSITSKREQQEKALRNITGKVQRASRGEYQGGYPPYGFDVVCFDLSGREKWRVQWIAHHKRIKIVPKGKPESFDGKNNFPAKDPTDVLRYRPSTIKERVKVAKQIFDWVATESISPTQVATRLNQMKVDPVFGDGWNKVKVAAMLLHPIYVGFPTWNKRAGSRFWEFVNGQFSKVEATGKAVTGRSRKTVDFVQPDKPEFPPVVDAKTFERVQSKLKASSDAHNRPRSPRKPEMWLRNFLICGKCGKPMRAWRAKDWKDCYMCGTYGTYGIENPTGCRCHRVKAEVVDQIVGTYLDELGRKAEFLDRVNAGEKITQPMIEKHWGKQSELVGYFQEMKAFIADRLGEGEREIDLGLSMDGQPLPPVLVTVADDHIETNFNAVGVGDIYKHLFQEHEKQIGRRLKTKERQYDELFEKFKLLTGQRALGKASEQLAALEAEIESLKESLRPLQELSRQVYAEVEQLRAAIKEAKSAVKNQQGRRKADALGRIVERIVCYFKSSDESGANRPKSNLDRVEIIPVTGQTVSMFPNGITPGRANFWRSVFFRELSSVEIAARTPVSWVASVLKATAARKRKAAECREQSARRQSENRL